MASANYNVSGRGLPLVFAHFRGLGSFMRKAKLKLPVYGDVMRQLNNQVRIRSRLKRKDAFVLCLPGERMRRIIINRERGTTNGVKIRGQRGGVLVTRSIRSDCLRVGTFLGGRCAVL